VSQTGGCWRATTAGSAGASSSPGCQASWRSSFDTNVCSGRTWSVTFVELHAHSAYSFLDGASRPEELAARAAELGYPALALTDHDGVYGSLEFARAAKFFGI